MSEQPRHTRHFDGFGRDHESDMMVVLAVFIRERGGIGLTEGQLVKQSGITENEALRQVANLEKGGFVCSFICQEGTAGPYARRYKLVSSVELKFELSKPE